MQLKSEPWRKKCWNSYSCVIKVALLWVFISVKAALLLRNAHIWTSQQSPLFAARPGIPSVLVIYTVCPTGKDTRTTRFDASRLDVPSVELRCNPETNVIDCHEAVPMLNFLIANYESPLAKKYIFIHGHEFAWHHTGSVFTVEEAPPKYILPDWAVWGYLSTFLWTRRLGAKRGTLGQSNLPLPVPRNVNAAWTSTSRKPAPVLRHFLHGLLADSAVCVTIIGHHNRQAFGQTCDLFPLDTTEAKQHLAWHNVALLFPSCSRARIGIRKTL